MNKKGNIIIIGLVLLNFIMIISQIISINLNQKLLFNKIDPNMNIIKIKVIQRIEKEFKNNQEDFEFEENSVYVTATFDGLDYYVIIDGTYHYEMLISYDYVFECIENIEYYYDE